jgi:hypothetical protein
VSTFSLQSVVAHERFCSAFSHFVITRIHTDIDNIFEPLMTACGELGQNHMADKVVSTIFLTF